MRPDKELSEEELETGCWYKVILYDGEKTLLRYLGGDEFDDGGCMYTFKGDVRYVVEKVCDKWQ